MKRNILAITLGDPAGIGPEIAAKVIEKSSMTRLGSVVFVGCEWASNKLDRV